MTARTVFIAALAMFIVTGAFVLDYRVVDSILKDGKSAASDSTLLGVILASWNGAALGVIVNFFYGRSSDSDRKTEMIAQSNPAQATSTTVTPGKTTTETAPVATPEAPQP